MDLWRIEVEAITPRLDVQAASILGDLRDLGISQIKRVRTSRIFLLTGRIDRSQADRIAAELLADPVTERYVLAGVDDQAREAARNGAQVEVHLKPGVMDPVANSTRQAIRQMDVSVDDVRTARRYVFEPDPGRETLELIATRVLANECIEDVFFERRPLAPPPEPPSYQLKVKQVPLRQLDEAGLADLSTRADLFLSVDEMRAIQDYYRRLDRDPTDVELEMLAQTWSEHCVHKTFRSEVVYRGQPMPGGDGSGTVELHYGNLLADTVARATRELMADGRADWCIVVFDDNAGIIEFDDENGVALKVETHNHPSAIEPYGGAATGIGGVIRDIVGCGMGAKPIANTDVFCFAPPQMKLDELPRGVLHPRRVMKGVVSGVRDYGNRMGIPTVNGAICFHPRYLGNPLVFCGCIGLIPKRFARKQPREGDLIVVVGGRTGRDGIHGATFSSAELTDTHADEFSHAVQIGDAITEKTFLDTLLAARDHEDGPLYTAITDCGAGGLSSAVGEMGAELGAVVDLEKVPLKYAGLRYDEIWISEAQERMVLSVPPDRAEKLLALLTSEDVEATVIGHYGNERRLLLRYAGTTVGELDMKFVHEGFPRSPREASWSGSEQVVRAGRNWAAEPGGLEERLKRCLADPNVASKEWVIRQYDHEVQGGSVVKPLVGADQGGPADAAVVRPRLDSERGLAIGCGICPELGQVDPYWMAVASIDEAIRNVVCVGGDPQRTAILDNFCWGDCGDADKLGGFVRASQACYDAAKAYGTPFVSGKDSLHNEFRLDPADAERLGLDAPGGRIAIPPTLLVTAGALVWDVSKCVTSDLKQAGNLLVLVGVLKDCWDEVKLEQTAAVHRAVARCISDRLVASAHDCNEGGAALAVAEMSMGGMMGAQCWLDESLGMGDPLTPVVCGYVLEVSPDNADAVTKVFDDAGVTHVLLGRVSRTRRLQWYDRLQLAAGRVRRRGRMLTDIPIDDLREAWEAPLRW